MKDILNDVNATFGGHKNACGIEIMKKILSILNKNYWN
jgi:hypothetical protein